MRDIAHIQHPAHILLAHDGAARRYDFRCPECGDLERDIPYDRLHLQQHPDPAMQSVTSVKHACRACGHLRCFTTDLEPIEADPDHPLNSEWRAAEVQRIRALCLALGMQRDPHPAVRRSRDRHRELMLAQLQLQAEHQEESLVYYQGAPGAAHQAASGAGRYGRQDDPDAPDERGSARGPSRAARLILG